MFIHAIAQELSDAIAQQLLRGGVLKYPSPALILDEDKFGRKNWRKGKYLKKICAEGKTLKKIFMRRQIKTHPPRGDRITHF